MNDNDNIQVPQEERITVSQDLKQQLINEENNSSSDNNSGKLNNERRQVTQNSNNSNNNNSINNPDEEISILESNEIEWSFPFQRQCCHNIYFSRILMILCVIYIFQDIFTHEKFFEASTKFTIEIQKSADSKAWINFNKIVSKGCLGVMAVFALILFYYMKNRAQFYSFIIFFVASLYIMTTLKLFYNDMRPYMIPNTDIIAIECDSEFGNPSGHAMLNLVAFATFPYCFDNKFYSFKNNAQTKICPKKIIICVLNAIWILFIGYTRVQVGVHSLNQIFLGYVYGLLFVTLYIEYLDTFLIDLLKKSVFLGQQKKFKYLKMTIIGYIIYTGLTIAIYELVKNTTKQTLIDDAIIAIEQKCGKEMNESFAKFLYNKCFVDAGVLAAVFGIFVAVYSSNGRTYVSGDSYEIQHMELSYIKHSYRMAVQCLIPGIPVLPFLLMGSLVFEKETYLKFFVGMQIPLFLAGFLLVFVTPIALSKLKLDIKGDYLQVADLLENLEQITKQNNNNNQKYSSSQQSYFSGMNYQPIESGKTTRGPRDSSVSEE